MQKAAASFLAATFLTAAADPAPCCAPPIAPTQLQFHMGGSAGVALVSADMYRGPEGSWQYLYLVVDVANQGSQQPQRLFIVNP